MYLQSHIYKNIPVSFDFITTWNQEVFLCSSCILLHSKLRGTVGRESERLREKERIRSIQTVHTVSTSKWKEQGQLDWKKTARQKKGNEEDTNEDKRQPMYVYT